MRAAYSVVEADTWIRPHFGMTNSQLKLHLGLIVPTSDDGSGSGSECARMRGGNSTRGWGVGQVIFFDDSFEHEVRNECSSKRVVFQVVIRHPDVPPRPGDGNGDYAPVVMDNH